MSRRYVKEVFEEIGYLPTWLPNVRHEVGQVGRIEKHGFVHHSTAKDLLGAGVRRRSQAAFGSKLDLRSKRGVSQRLKVAGAALPDSGLLEQEAGIELAFAEEGGFVIQLLGCSIEQGLDLDRLQDAVLEAWNDGLWDKDWVIITEVVRGDSGAVVVSQGAQAKLDVAIAGGLDGLPLARTDVKLTARETAGSVFNVLGEQGLTPLYRALRLARPWFGRPRLEAAVYRGREEEGGRVLADLTPEDLEAEA